MKYVRTKRVTLAKASPLDAYTYSTALEKDEFKREDSFDSSKYISTPNYVISNLLKILKVSTVNYTVYENKV